MQLKCPYFDHNQCRSCSGLEYGVNSWREAKFNELRTLIQSSHWLEPLWSQDIFGSRTKAKFAIGGSLENPLIGRSLRDGAIVDIRGCSLHHPVIKQQVETIERWIKDYKLTPYDASSRKGELKFVILQLGESNQLMLRFVLRSKEAIDRVQKLVRTLGADSPYKVISVNIQPKHAALIEGEEEIILTDEHYLPIKIGKASLLLGTKSFVQTNLMVAGKLYEEAGHWLESEQGRILDLFCGIGGFAAHVGGNNRQVFGVELSKEAITAAKKAVSNVDFVAMDAWDYIKNAQAFDIVIVNPPRRGLGAEICQHLRSMRPKKILYSSCNPLTLKEDIDRLGYEIEKIKAFEMFPMTDHWEVLVLLTRNQE